MVNEPVMELGGRRIGATHDVSSQLGRRRARSQAAAAVKGACCHAAPTKVTWSAVFDALRLFWGAVGWLSGHQLTGLRLRLMLDYLGTRQAQKNPYNSYLTEDETWLLKSTHSNPSQEDFKPTVTISKWAELYRPESTLGSSGGRIRLASAAHWFRSAAAAPLDNHNRM